jgi:undecaprenyl-phosphate 4-deoxy-4-formamido-L-arabinose transferase
MPKKSNPAIDLSVVIPVYNEELTLRKLAARLFPALDKLGKTYEVIFTNDGSIDDSWIILKALQKEYVGKITLVDFNANYGQHMAIMAGFANVKGQVVVTMDADLQNPPEEIGKLLAKMDEGFDMVGGYRANRHENDHIVRRYSSKLMNLIRSKVTNIHMRDQGCMLRAYSRSIVDMITETVETSTFIPALAYKLAAKPTEVEVKHEARVEGTSNYSFYELIRVTLDLFTGFSLVPLHIFSIGGGIISFLSMLLCGYLMLRRLIIGPEADGMFTLFAIMFFLMGICITGIGIVGEYIGRTYQAVCRRPRYLIREVLDHTEKDA